MKTRVVLSLLAGLLCCAVVSAQQPPQQPLTFVSDYTVKPGKEADFMELVRTVGAPVRDKLMAEGVILGWGIDVPLMRAPGQPTHSIWYDVAGWDGIQKVQSAMAAKMDEMRAADKKPAGAKAAATKTFDERVADIMDTSKTRDWVFRNLYANFQRTPPPADLLPYSRIFLITVKPGKDADWRAAWDKYNKPLLDRLVADGTIGVYGIGVEEVRTEGSFTHFVFAGAANLAAFDKVRNAFLADRNARTPEEQRAIIEAFTSATDPTMARSFVLRAVVFKLAPQK